MTMDTGAYNDWFNSDVGQQFNRAQEAAAAYARKQGDAKMENDKRALDIEVMKLRQQGRMHEAEMRLKEGDQQIARERLALEVEIERGKLALDRERFGLEREEFGLKEDIFGLEQDKFGLTRAEAIAKYQSSPDFMFMRNDFLGALDRAGIGLGQAPYGAQGAPRPNTVADFERLEGERRYRTTTPLQPGQTGYLPPDQQQAGGDMRGSGVPLQAGEGQVSTGQLHPVPDPRIKASRAVLDALPPSEADGLDDNDRAALAAIENIRRAKRPGTLQRMRPGQQAAFAGGLSRLGYYAPDAISDVQRAGIGQGSTRGY